MFRRGRARFQCSLGSSNAWSHHAVPVAQELSYGTCGKAYPKAVYYFAKNVPRKLTNGDGWVFSKGIAGKWVGRTIAEPLVSQEEGPDSSNEAWRENMGALGPCKKQRVGRLEM